MALNKLPFHISRMLLFSVAFVLSIATISFYFSPQANAQTINGGWQAPLPSLSGNLAGFLANGCNGNQGYIANKYHIGHDFGASVGTPVYAIGPGTVIHTGSFGTGYANAIFVQHEAGDGSDFVALYGHVNVNTSTGATVSAGQQIGTIASIVESVPHLHFGVRPGTSYPVSNWGMMDCPIGSTNGFVDPLPYLAAHPISGGTQSTNVVFTNGGGETYANSSPSTNPWTKLSNTTSAISASGNYVAYIDGCGAAWATSNFASVPATQITGCGGATSIVIGSQGNLAFIDGCGGAKATNTYNNPNSWVQLTGCGGATKVATGGGGSGTLGMINSCGALSVTQNYQNWTQVTPCNGATNVSVGPTGTLAFVNGCGASNITDNYLDPSHWIQLTGCNGTQKISVGANHKVVFIDGCGAAKATDTYTSPSSWVALTGCNGAQEVTSGSVWTGVINGCGSLNITVNYQSWTQIAPCSGALLTAAG